MPQALPAAILIAAFGGTGSSFLDFATIAAKRGLRAHAHPSKGIYYLSGLTEGAETIALFVAMCLLSEMFSVLTYGFAVACAVTIVTRWHQGWVAFDPEENSRELVTDSAATCLYENAPAE
jgi:hypothetical protein